ncbi:MAG: T9SS type A sorting domain-containing protein [Ignavibacteria bacterium]
MKKIFYAFLYISILSSFQSIQAQDYIELMDDPSINFYEVQRKFYEYWGNKNYEKGKGWKQFKRWEEFMEPRTFPTGVRFDPSGAFQEYNKYKKEYLNSDKKVFGNWTPLGPTNWSNGSEGYNPGNGRINCVYNNPLNPNIIYAGAPAGGLWKSTNNGGTWTVLTDHLAVLGVSSIAIHPSNPNVIYIGTGDGDGGQTYSIGVLKSIDGGITWNTTGLSYNVFNFVRINKLIIHPSDPNILFAVSNQGIHKSTNAGVNWTQPLSGFNMRDIEFKPGAPQIIYSSGATFRKSTDGGESFTIVTSGLPASGIQRLAIGVSPANIEYVYLLASRSSNGGFLGYYRSTNGGNDFTTMSSSPNLLGYEISGSDQGGQGSYDLVTAVSPDDINTVYTGGINLWKSTNGGANFFIISHWYYPNNLSYPYVHADQHFLDYFGTRLFAGCDGGLFVTTNSGANFTDLSSGLNIMQFYKFGGTPQSPNRIIGGTQDNGSNLYNGAQWTHLFGADGGEAIVDYSDSNTLYCEYQNGGILKSTNGGENFSDATAGISENGAFITPYLIHPSNPQILFAGFQNVWKTTNGAASWELISTTLGTGTINALAISQSNPDYIYTSKGNIIYKTTNGGSTWLNISTGLSGLSITYISVHSVNPDILWVTNSGYTSGQKIYKTQNGGVNWNNVTGSLPNLPANCVTYENGPKEGVYVGMDVGIYYTNNQLQGWVPFDNLMPNVIVREIEIHYPTNKVKAATLGRGIWQATLASILVGVEQISENIPNNYNLKQNFPNPFNPETQILFDIPKKGYVTLKVYDGLGKEIAQLLNENKSAGSYEVNFIGSKYSSGTYYYRIEVESEGTVNYAMTRKMILLK